MCGLHGISAAAPPPTPLRYSLPILSSLEAIDFRFMEHSVRAPSAPWSTHLHPLKNSFASWLNLTLHSFHSLQSTHTPAEISDSLTPPYLLFDHLLNLACLFVSHRHVLSRLSSYRAHCILFQLTLILLCILSNKSRCRRQILSYSFSSIFGSLRLYL